VTVALLALLLIIVMMGKFPVPLAEYPLNDAAGVAVAVQE
jgi:hypothetical protein